MAGPLVHRVSARRLVPVFRAPLLLSCLVLAVSEAPLAAPVYLGLMGLGTAMSFVGHGGSRAGPAKGCDGAAAGA